MIEGLPGSLKRASGFIAPDGTFTCASFELREAHASFLRDDWTWLDNPFAGTRELKGLKILVMLLSDWDNKDRRDAGRGSNTGIVERQLEDGSMVRNFYVTDWGQSMGAWGRFRGRSHWNCSDYSRQSARFITGNANGRVSFGFGGQHTVDFVHDITAADIRWMMERLGRISDAQIRAGLKASGASSQEEQCFAGALRARIDSLRRAAEPQVRGLP